MTRYDFTQLDVFSDTPMMGNPLAVVHNATGLSDGDMARFANWTNLSETTFLLPPDRDGTDYKVRIFTPTGELPFAGHPTLGSCHAWLMAGGAPANPDIIQQDCAAGVITIRRDGPRLAFGAPPLIRSGPAEPEVWGLLSAGFGISPNDVEAVEWIDNGPGWCGVLLHDVKHLRAAKPNYPALNGIDFGLVAPAQTDADYDFELRAFTCGFEDPVTGSLNASVAQWLIGAGLAPPDYIAAQGLELGRNGRVHITREGNDIWVGGVTTPCIQGTLTL